MKIKTKIAKKEYNKLSDTLKEIYVKVDDEDFYVLDSDDNRASEAEANLADSLNKSWERKYNKLKQDSENAILEVSKALKEVTINNTAKEVAVAVAGENSAIILPHILPRLKSEVKNGKASISILDSEGKPSALTKKELTKEFKENEIFKAVVIKSKGSGVGEKSRGDPKANDMTLKELREMTATEENEWAKNNPDKYNQLTDSWDPLEISVA